MYTQACVVCEHERILASLLFDLTVKQSDASSSAKKRRECFLGLTDDLSGHRIVFVPATALTPIADLSSTRIKKKKKRKNEPSELDGDDDSGGVGDDWPQINCRLSTYARGGYIIPRSRSLLSLLSLPRSHLLAAHKKTISQPLIRARPTSPFYRINYFFIPGEIKAERIASAGYWTVLGSRC